MDKGTTLAKNNKSKQSCCVPDCNKPGYVTDNGKQVTFHVLAKDKKILKIWIIQIGRDVGPLFKITPHTKICSRHFTEDDFRITYRGKKFLKRNAVPSIFNRNKSSSWRSRDTKNSASSSNQETSRVCVTNSVTDSDIVIALDSQCTAGTESTPTVNCMDALQARIAHLEAQLKGEKARSDIYRKERDHVRQVLHTTTINLGKEQDKGRFSIEQFKDKDSKICFYTGFPTYHALTECFRLMDTVNNIMYRRHGKRRELKVQSLYYMDQFCLVLVRLRLGLLVNDLADRFLIRMPEREYIIASNDIMHGHERYE